MRGSIECGNCAPGFYQGATGQSACVACESGKEAKKSGSNYCEYCPSGFDALPGSAVCDRCAENYWWGTLEENCERVVSVGGGSQEKWECHYECRKCPEGFKCFGGLLLPKPLDGWWVDRAAAVKAPWLFGVAYPCPRATCNYPPNPTLNRTKNDSSVAKASGDGSSNDELESTAAGSGGAGSGSAAVSWRERRARHEREKRNGRALAEETTATDDADDIFSLMDDDENAIEVDPCWLFSANGTLAALDDDTADCFGDGQLCAEGSTGALCGACQEKWSFNSGLQLCTECSSSATWYQVSE